MIHGHVILSVGGCVLPDFIGSGRIHVLSVVCDSEHSHAQTLIFYLVLLYL